MTDLVSQTPIPPKPRRIVGKHFRCRHIRRLALRQVHFVDCTFSSIALNDCDLRELHFEGCRFINLRLESVTLDTASLRTCTIDDLRARNTQLFSLSSIESPWRAMILDRCQVERWVMAGCSLENARWQHSRISYWTAQNTPVTDLTFSDGEMQDGNWHDCALTRVRWSDCAISRQVMGSCVLDECHYAGCACDVLVWSNCQLNALDLRKLNLANTSFQFSRLRECHLAESNLNAAQFCGATLDRCDFSHANADYAQFSDATLNHCRLVQTRLQRAVLVRVRLVNCSLMQADLSHADMRGCDALTSPLQPAITHKTRLHDARLQPLDWALKTPDPLMAQIDSWYQRHQPGPIDSSSFPPLPSGASRYV